MSCIHYARYQVCLTTIYACGLRLQEGVFLQVKDIDGARKMVHVHLGKGGKDRYVPLPDAALNMLRRYWATHRNRVWLYPSLRAKQSPEQINKPMSESSVQDAFGAALLESRVKKDATVHTLRHYVECWIMVSV